MVILGAAPSVSAAVLNVSNVTRTVTVEVCETSGVCPATNTVESEPGQGISLTFNTGIVTSQYCKVTVDGGKNTLGALLSVVGPDDVPAVVFPLE